MCSSLQAGGSWAIATRHALLDVELAAEELASAAEGLAFVPDLPGRLRSGLIEGLTHLRRGELSEARRQLAEVAQRTAAAEELPIGVARHLRDAIRALQQLLEGLDVCLDQTPIPPHVREFQPAVQLFLGNLPSSAPTAVAAISDAQSWWSRRSLKYADVHSGGGSRKHRRLRG